MKKQRQVQAYMSKAGLKPYELAAMVKIPQTTFYRWLKGNGNLLLRDWEKLEKRINKAS